jgi:hypothetical protein
MIGGWGHWAQTGRLGPVVTDGEGPAEAEPCGLGVLAAHAVLRPRVKPPRLDPRPRLACAARTPSEMTVISGTGH